MRAPGTVTLLLATAACGADPVSPLPTRSADAGAAGGAGLEASTPGYPPGPYGPAAGQTAPDLTLVGYVSDDPSALAYAAPLETLTLGELRERLVHSHALLHVSGFT